MCVGDPQTHVLGCSFNRLSSPTKKESLRDGAIEPCLLNPLRWCRSPNSLNYRVSSAETSLCQSQKSLATSLLKLHVTVISTNLE